VGVPDGADPDARREADPRHFGSGLGAGADRARHEPKLAELGITVPDVVPPVVVYQSAVRDGDRVFTSGQLPMKDGQLMTPGKLGGAVSEEAGRRRPAVQAERPGRQVGALSAIKRVVKVIVFMASEPGFTAQPKIANGASEFLGEVFGAVESCITCWAATSR